MAVNTSHHEMIRRHIWSNDDLKKTYVAILELEHSRAYPL